MSLCEFSFSLPSIDIPIPSFSLPSLPSFELPKLPSFSIDIDLDISLAQTENNKQAEIAWTVQNPDAAAESQKFGLVNLPKGIVAQLPQK